MNPAATKLVIILNKANIITTSPAVLKNIPDFELFLTLKELKLIRASTGKVPRANAIIVSPPVRKLPVVRLYNCIDWVKPHGRKNVATPTRRGVRV